RPQPVPVDRVVHRLRAARPREPDRAARAVRRPGVRGRVDPAVPDVARGGGRRARPVEAGARLVRRPLHRSLRGVPPRGGGHRPRAPRRPGAAVRDRALLRDRLMIDLTGKVVLVTGSASGIGAAAVELMTGAGGSVAGFDLRESAAALSLTGDVTRAAELEAAVAPVEERFGGLDALVSNAGLFLAGGGDGPSPQLAEENWQRTIDVNLKSVYLGAKYAIPA